MRERTTWSREAIIKLATSPKVAEDPRAMNQDHLKQQPSADKYVTGDPSAFAEDVHPATGTWKAEYSGEEVKRNEIGLPEMRSDTFNHAEKTAADDDDDDAEDDDFLEKKAEVCLRLARRVLTKTASSEVLEDQALAFMHLPNEALIDTVTRLAAQDEEEEEQQAQEKQAGKIPPQFLENVKKKKEEAAEKDDEGQAQQKQAQQQEEEQQAQQKQAQDEGQQAQAQDQGRQKQAQHDQIAQLQQQAQQIQEQIAQLQQQAQGQQQIQSQAQQIAQAVQQAIAQGQDPAQACQQLLAQLQGQPVAQQQVQDPVLSDDQLFDQVIQQQPVMANVDSMDIELENNLMDIGTTHLANEDETLRALFANEEVQDAEEAQQIQEKQAGVRTASTRTVGTRPTAGVSQIGGRVASSSTNDVDKLSSLWQSSPDVRNVFGS
jgi:hypothetical protein